MAAVIIAVTVVFLVVEALIWTGYVRVEALGNLGYGKIGRASCRERV